MLYVLFLYSFLRMEDIKLDYIITTPNRKNFVRLDSNGTPEVCSSNNDAQRFEFSKAKNLLDHLPKVLKKFHFKVEAVPEIVPKKNECIDNSKNRVISKDTDPAREKYVPSDNVIRWVEKFGSCEDILTEAKQREEQLLGDLYKADSELMDILHIIEIEKPKDLYNSWLLYKRIKANRKKRRDMKDELIIVENVLKKLTDISCLHRKNIQKAINGLFNRQYTFRFIEENEDDL